MIKKYLDRYFIICFQYRFLVLIALLFSCASSQNQNIDGIAEIIIKRVENGKSNLIEQYLNEDLLQEEKKRKA